MEKGKIIRSLAYKFTERFAVNGIGLVISIVLGRLLAPDLFGQLALVTVFTDADFDRLRNHLLDALVIELKRICRFCSDRANAVAAMESILAADFYRDFLAAGYRGGGGGARRAANRFAVGLLQKRRFEALRFFCARVYRGR